jgi:DUF4097 and DUF4098 domain-containing protein YvlB
MRHRVLAGLLLLAAPQAIAAQQKVDVRRRATSDVSVRIAGTYGFLRIVGTASDSLVLTGTIPREARFESFEGGKGVDPITGAKVYIDVPNDQQAAAGTLEMRVPARARVWAKAGNATIEVSGVSGGLDLNIVGGAIRVTSSPRELNIESMDGSVTIDGTAAWLRVKTAAGDITMRGSSEDAAFTSVSGTIRITAGGLFERSRFETVTGGIEFAADFARGGSATFDSHSGAVDLRLRREVGAEIEATSIAGTIENALTRARPTRGREQRGQELTTATGDGGARVVVRTFKGPIRLRSST